MHTVNGAHDDVLAEQAEHSLYPALSEYLPVLQLVHAVAPSVSVYCPAGHETQAAVAVSAAMVPAGQAEHVSVAAMLTCCLSPPYPSSLYP